LSIIPDKKKSDNKYIKAIGLMSGTSMDGIDVALIESDGFSIKKENKFLFLPYSKIFQKKLRELINNPSLNSKLSLDVTKQITKIHIEAVQKFIKKYNLDYKYIDLIGFHGHTILHRPDQKLTWQIGDCRLLEKVLNIKVVGDLRNVDIKNGGQGAPLAPIYHHALLKDYFSEEVIFMNIGGVANITYVTEGANDLIAGDICFGNAPMDDLVYKKLGKNFDKSGEIARNGKINLNLSDEFLRLEFFKRSFPKSIDRNEFSSYLDRFNDLELNDALASLVDIISKSLIKSLDLLPKKPKKIIISGGGAKNIFLLEKIAEITGLEILNAKNFNINIDSVEAELFAFLAIRNFYNLPLSYAKL
jgi:anhydro-N-acetylmuramic acid kinase